MACAEGQPSVVFARRGLLHELFQGSTCFNYISSSRKQADSHTHRHQETKQGFRRNPLCDSNIRQAAVLLCQHVQQSGSSLPQSERGQTSASRVLDPLLPPVRGSTCSPVRPRALSDAHRLSPYGLLVPGQASRVKFPAALPYLELLLQSAKWRAPHRSPTGPAGPWLPWDPGPHSGSPTAGQQVAGSAPSCPATAGAFFRWHRCCCSCWRHPGALPAHTLCAGPLSSPNILLQGAWGDGHGSPSCAPLLAGLGMTDSLRAMVRRPGSPS